MATPTITSGCCCPPQAANYQCISDCIFDLDITSGCCHWDDTLLLWNERPSYSIRQQYRITDVGDPGSTPCETCLVTSQRALPPVQSIYKYHSCWWRAVYAQVHPVELATPWPVADNTLSQGSGCANPVCEPEYCPDNYSNCCNDDAQFQDPANCACKAHYGQGKGGITEWRRDKLLENHDTTWFVEMTCHKSGDPLNASQSIARLDSGWLCNVFFERWWKIAECPPTARIYVPECNQTSSDCDGEPFVTSNLVPKWWIFGCSGCPLYQWELDEALELGVIDSGEYVEVVEAIQRKDVLPQQPLFKMAEAGYLVAKDWRAVQRQAYIDLHARFPSAGYGSCIQNLESMNIPNGLGPFRKRYTAPYAAGVAAPYLNNSDVIQELQPYQGCNLKNFPGGTEDDYRFWRERQWVYFRGIPGGWIWAGWNSLAACGSECSTEEDAILKGYGRGVGVGGDAAISAPMLAFAGNPRPPATLSNCNFSGNEVCNDTIYCDSTDGGCDECGTGPVEACDPPSVCLKLTVDSMCEGVHFISHFYTFLNRLDPDPNSPQECSAEGKYVCRSVHSFLVEARRKVDSWDLAIPFRCRTMNQPLGPFQQFPAIVDSHSGPQPMCNQLMDENDTEYDSNPMCCGGYCNGFVDVPYDGDSPPCFSPGSGENTLGCPVKTERQDACVARGDCPPHGTQKQMQCINHPIICFDIEPIPPEWEIPTLP